MKLKISSAEIDKDLTSDCENLNKELQKLNEKDKEIEKNTLELQKQEEKARQDCGGMHAVPMAAADHSDLLFLQDFLQR